jgi:hypothetical protein
MLRDGHGPAKEMGEETPAETLSFEGETRTVLKTLVLSIIFCHLDYCFA